MYENRGEKLGVARLDLNDRLAAKIQEADLDPDQAALLEKLLGKDYEVITADDRLDKIAEDFVGHCATRWEAGKSMLACIDKVACARMLQRIVPRWKAKATVVRLAAEAKRAELMAETDPDARDRLQAQADHLSAQAEWLDQTLIEIVVSEGQSEVADFKRWGFDIISHRALMKQGFVDYNGMLKSLREALAQYALDDAGNGDEEIVAPIEERVQALIEAIEATEAQVRALGFEMQ